MDHKGYHRRSTIKSVIENINTPEDDVEALFENEVAQLKLRRNLNRRNTVSEDLSSTLFCFENVLNNDSKSPAKRYEINEVPSYEVPSYEVNNSKNKSRIDQSHYQRIIQLEKDKYIKLEQKYTEEQLKNAKLLKKINTLEVKYKQNEYKTLERNYQIINDNKESKEADFEIILQHERMCDSEILQLKNEIANKEEEYYDNIELIKKKYEKEKENLKKNYELASDQLQELQTDYHLKLKIVTERAESFQTTNNLLTNKLKQLKTLKNDLELRINSLEQEIIQEKTQSEINLKNYDIKNILSVELKQQIIQNEKKIEEMLKIQDTSTSKIKELEHKLIQGEKEIEIITEITKNYKYFLIYIETELKNLIDSLSFDTNEQNDAIFLENLKNQEENILSGLRINKEHIEDQQNSSGNYDDLIFITKEFNMKNIIFIIKKFFFDIISELNYYKNTNKNEYNSVGSYLKNIQEIESSASFSDKKSEIDSLKNDKQRLVFELNHAKKNIYELQLLLNHEKKITNQLNGYFNTQINEITQYRIDNDKIKNKKEANEDCVCQDKV